MPAARKSGQRAIPIDQAKPKVLDALAQGATVREAMASVGRSEHTYKDWYREDPKFQEQVKLTRSVSVQVEGLPDGREVPDFETFARDWLHEPAYPHHMRMIDVIEGREPRDLHGSMAYERGTPGMVVINVPPNFGKTSQITTNYVVWRIHKDPSISVLIISKSQQFAKNILWDVKRILTDSQYREMHLTFAPGGTWESKDDPWTADSIYVNQPADAAVSGVVKEKDPTIQVLGIKGQIYGRRAHLIIVDDAVDETNTGDYEAQQRWLMKTVYSRLPPEGGELILVGTRMGSIDLYKTMRDLPNEYAEPGEPSKLFTYLGQPAVLDYGDGTPDGWVSLWPETVDKSGAVVPRWTGRKLARRRSAVGEREWALVYQQQDVADDAVFNEQAVNASVNRGRFPGPMRPNTPAHRPGGRDGLYVVAGLDPATVGHTAIVVTGLDRNWVNSKGDESPKRWVLDGLNVESMSLATLHSEMKCLTEAHQINEWVIERNAAQLYLLQDKDLNDWMRNRGVKMTPHNTNVNKQDADFGVMGMAQLFDSCVEVSGSNAAVFKRVAYEDMLIELPAPQQNAWVGALVSQLITWAPSDLKYKQKTDLVMALWFTEIAVRRILGYGRKRMTHMPSHWGTPAAARGQRVVDLAAVRQAKREAEVHVA